MMNLSTNDIIEGYLGIKPLRSTGGGDPRLQSLWLSSFSLVHKAGLIHEQSITKRHHYNDGVKRAYICCLQ
jgi:hypothetical protein